MENGKNTGLLGFLGLIACVALYFAARKFFPALSTLLLWVLGIAAVLIVVLVVVVIFAAVHKPKKTPEQERSEVQEMVLKKARASLMELRTSAMRVKQQQVRENAQNICVTLNRTVGSSFVFCSFRIILVLHTFFILIKASFRNITGTSHTSCATEDTVHDALSVQCMINSFS